MKNVTVAIDDETHRKARIYAAAQGTSLSALVKDYLNTLTVEAGTSEGVKEMAMPYEAAATAAPADDGPPWLVNGKWVYTRDGKPRKPGVLKGKLWIADDFDETPDWLLDAFEGKDSHLPPPE